MSKKLQVTVDNDMIKELDEIKTTHRFFDTSETIRHCLREFIEKYKGKRYTE